MNKPTEKELSDFVNREVYVNQSMLVEELFKKEIFNFEDITNFYGKTNFKDWQAVQGETYLKNNKEEEQRKDYEDREEEPQEIFEWYATSDWLLEKLEAEGEPILKTDYGTWWGRTTTGQAISMDYVIEKIYKDLHKNN